MELLHATEALYLKLADVLAPARPIPTELFADEQGMQVLIPIEQVRRKYVRE